MTISSKPTSRQRNPSTFLTLSMRADISPIYFDKPYYLVPLKNGQRAYALLREVMKRTGKVGIARVVIRSRQHLAALLADGAVLILNLLRFSHELRDPSALDVPAAGSALGSNQELKMAEQLVETMAGKWNPKKYRDEYHQDLLQMIDKKIKSGQTKTIEPAEATPGLNSRAKSSISCTCCGRVWSKVTRKLSLRDAVKRAKTSSLESVKLEPKIAKIQTYRNIAGARRAKLPAFVRPQLATLVDSVPQGDEWLHEIKFDGYRILCRIDEGRANF